MSRLHADAQSIWPHHICRFRTLTLRRAHQLPISMGRWYDSWIFFFSLLPLNTIKITADLFARITNIDVDCFFNFPLSASVCVYTPLISCQFIDSVLISISDEKKKKNQQSTFTHAFGRWIQFFDGFASISMGIASISHANFDCDSSHSIFTCKFRITWLRVTSVSKWKTATENYVGGVRKVHTHSHIRTWSLGLHCFEIPKNYRNITSHWGVQ